MQFVKIEFNKEILNASQPARQTWTHFNLGMPGIVILVHNKKTKIENKKASKDLLQKLFFRNSTVRLNFSMLF